MTQMDHFCDHSIIRARVLVRDSRNREGNFEQVAMLHDMAGCMRAKETHDLLDEKNVDFFRFSGYGRWAWEVSWHESRRECWSHLARERGGRTHRKRPCDHHQGGSGASGYQDFAALGAQYYAFHQPSALISTPFGPSESCWGQKYRWVLKVSWFVLCRKKNRQLQCVTLYAYHI